MNQVQQDLTRSKLNLSFYQEIYETKIQMLAKQNEIKDQQIAQLKQLLDEQNKPRYDYHCADCIKNKLEQKRQQQTQLRLISLLKEKNQEVQVLRTKLISQKSFSKKNNTEEAEYQQQFFIPYQYEKKVPQQRIQETNILNSEVQSPQNLFDLSQSQLSEEFMQLYTTMKRTNTSF